MAGAGAAIAHGITADIGTDITTATMPATGQDITIIITTITPPIFMDIETP
jgi:hypothetical protein